MDKFLFKIFTLIIGIAIVISLFEQCMAEMKQTAEEFKESLLNPLKSCSGDKGSSDPATTYVTINNVSLRVTQQQTKIQNINISLTTIKQEITTVVTIVEECNRHNERLEELLRQSQRDKETLLRWLEENKTYQERMEAQYKSLLTRMKDMEAEVKELKSEQDKLKRELEQLRCENELERLAFEAKKKELESHISSLAESVESLTREVSDSKKKINELKESLDDSIRQIEKLNKEINRLRGIVDAGDQQTTTQDTTYYYYVATKDELLSNEVVSSGGLFGGLKVNPEPDKDLFTSISKSEKSIFIGKAEAEYDVLSDMPADSYDYRNVNKKKYLIIKDAERFWSNTQYLIIRTDE